MLKESALFRRESKTHLEAAIEEVFVYFYEPIRILSSSGNRFPGRSRVTKRLLEVPCMEDSEKGDAQSEN